MSEPRLSERLAVAIAEAGPISVAKYMAAANAHYYATRDPFGVKGDFTTAPEISQIFGELVGLCLADLWIRGGRRLAHFVELGPGRGTLSADALRAMGSVGWLPEVHLVETSPLLQAVQAQRVPQAEWHADVASLPTDAPLLIVANEFFDALAIQPIIRCKDGWRQRRIGREDGRFGFVEGPLVPLAIIPDQFRDAPEESVIESCPDAVDIMRQLCQRIGEQGGAILIIDYGYAGPALGDTLQALYQHRFADPLEDPGERDLTAHVDFTTLAAMAELCGLAVHGAIDQGEWLGRLGLAERTEALALAHPEKASDLKGGSERLSSPEQMGRLFRVMAASSGDWPTPAGFAG
jgi:NADH dehydrogenase [ubiquinone] 1 alpha subcomplex assembly factor 7